MRYRFALPLALVCLAHALFAQTAGDIERPAPAQVTPQTKYVAPPPATARITGTVICSDTHRPARGAMVMAQPIPKEGNSVNVNPSASMSRVGMDGTYTLRHLHPGDYTIVALEPGYLSPFDDLKLEQTAKPNDTEMRDRLIRNGVVSVRENETAHMDVTIERGATISGRVLYSDGAPATQVLLNLEDIDSNPASKPHDPGTPDISAGALIRGLFLHQSQGTDDQGNFHIAGIKPGTYRLAAVQPAESLTDNDGDGFGAIFGFVPDSKSLRFYAGDTLHKNAAKNYELRAGDNVDDIEITIPVYAFHRVEGQLTTLDGQPVIVGTLALTDSSDDSFVLHSAPSRDGTFMFPAVPSGTYKLAVTDAKFGKAPDNYPEGMPVQAMGLQNSHALADASITILVKDADLSGVSVQLKDGASSTPSSENTVSPPE